jgi:hypothetical protein
MKNGNFVKFSVLGFVIGGLLLLSTNPQWLPAHTSPEAMANLAFVYAFLIFLPVLVFRMPDDIDVLSIEKRKRALSNLQTAIAASLFLDAAGGLGLFELYKVGIHYDKMVHFTVSSIFIVALAYFILEWYTPNIMKALAISAVVVLCGGIAWELIEFSSDFFFGTKRFGIRGENLVVDTALDLFMDALGTTGAVFLVLKRHNGKIVNKSL